MTRNLIRAAFPRASFNFARSSLLLAILWLCNIAAANALPRETKEFRTLVEGKIPIGTPIVVAKHRIEALGFVCVLAKGGWTNNIHDSTEFYSCQRKAGRIVLTRWSVSILPKQEKVFSVAASVHLVGP